MAKVESRPPASRQLSTKPKNAENESESIWSSMLDSVSSGTRIPEKTLLIMGGTVESQKNFLDALSSDSQNRRRNVDRPSSKRPPVANRFVLGYTYQDVLDTDQDDVLARLSEYLLSDPTLAFPSLVQPLFTPKSVQDFAVTILLDWGEPWNWLRQLRDWIRILKKVTATASNDVTELMAENMKGWSQKQKGPSVEAVNSSTEAEDESAPVTMGPGEWDEPLGVPLCVVCQNAEKIEILEREHGWKDQEFDTVLMYLRTVLLKHGASLIYTASSAPGSLQILIRASLDIHSLVQRNPLKHNVHDRDKVLVPPNWDSWGKIRLLQESCPGFDFEATSDGWSIDIQPEKSNDGAEASHEANGAAEEPDGSTVAAYEALIKNPDQKYSGETNGTKAAYDNELQCPSNQDFFAEQLQVLESLKKEEEQQKNKDARKGTASPVPGMRDAADGSSKISEHIGPVQFNMGGIQVDADEMLQTLREREAGRATSDEESSSFVSSPEGKSENETLRSFFASLASRGGSSATNSPR